MTVTLVIVDFLLLFSIAKMSGTGGSTSLPGSALTCACVGLVLLPLLSGGSDANLPDANLTETYLDDRFAWTPWEARDSGALQSLAAPSQTDRSGRIFQFSSKDSKIRLEMSFAIPFVEIPVLGSGKYASYASGQTSDPLVNVHVGALASAAILAGAAMLVVPDLFTGIAPQVLFGRSADGGRGGSTLARAMARIDAKLRAHNIEPATCAQRAACWVLSNAADKVSRGKGGSVDKVVDGLAGSAWLARALGLRDVVAHARSRADCSALYVGCGIDAPALQAAAVRTFNEA